MKKIFRVPSGWLLSLGILLSACGSGEGTAGLEFDGAWIRPVPSGMKMTAGFGVLRNPEKAVVELNSFTSPSFGDVSLHRTELVDGISRMKEVPVLSVAAGGEVVLEPGGFHLMLMMPAGEINESQMISIKMTSTDGRSFSFQVPVERR